MHKYAMMCHTWTDQVCGRSKTAVQWPDRGGSHSPRPRPRPSRPLSRPNDPKHPRAKPHRFLHAACLCRSRRSSSSNTKTVRSHLTFTVAPHNATVDLSWGRIQRMLSDRREEQRVLCVDDVHGYLQALPPALEQCAEIVQVLYLGFETPARLVWGIQPADKSGVGGG